jgi:hypothetical protein
MVTVRKSSTHRTGLRVELVFKLTQHLRDEKLMKSLIEYLDCGNVYSDKEAVIFKVAKLSDIADKIIPFFVKYPIKGVKAKDFADFCLVAELMKNKVHLTEEGLSKIRLIKAGMNSKR